MEVTLLKTSHEDRWLEVGWLLALQFKEGWAPMRIVARERSNLEPFNLMQNPTTGAITPLAPLTDVGWNTLVNPVNTQERFLEPPDQNIIDHYFWGVNKPRVRIFSQFPSRVDRGNLVSEQRQVGGAVGYISGDESPYEGPYSVGTEGFTVQGVYPAFNPWNPTADAMTNVLMKFVVMRYNYELVVSQQEAKAILLGERRRKLFNMGGIDPSPASAPQWLQNMMPKGFLAFTVSVMHGREV